MKLMNSKTLYFNNLTEEWLLFKKYSIKESTFYRYKYVIDTYLIKEFQNVKLSDLKKYNFNNYIERLSKTLSKSTVSNIVIILKSILRFCEKKYDYNFKLDLISKLKSNKDEVKVLSNEEIFQIERYCFNANNFKSLGILICINTGMRLGEVCSLQWGDIDLINKKIFIRKTMQRIYVEGGKSFVMIDTPKRENSKRIIPISKKLLDILNSYKKEYKFSNEDFLISGSNKYVEPRSMQRYFKIVLKNCRLQQYHFHALRHTFATKCIHIGMDVKSLSEILGHSSVDITLNRYVHSSFDTKIKVLDKLW